MPTSKNITAILLKNGITAALSLDTHVPVFGTDPVEIKSVLGRHDPRESTPITKSVFTNANCATDYFYRSLATSRENGWTINHLGPRNFD